MLFPAHFCSATQFVTDTSYKLTVFCLLLLKFRMFFGRGVGKFVLCSCNCFSAIKNYIQIYVLVQDVQALLLERQLIQRLIFINIKILNPKMLEILLLQSLNTFLHLYSTLFQSIILI